MERSDQGGQHDPQTRLEENPQTPTSISSPQQLTPQAALAAVTRGEHPPPPPPPPKPDTDTTTRRATTSTEKYYEDTASGNGDSPHRDPYRQSSGGAAIARPSRARSVREGTYQSGENVVPPSRRRRSGLDWIIPVDGAEKPYVPRQRTAGERLQPTHDQAKIEKLKYQKKAILNGYALNIAIGLQVLLGALITALAAAVKPSKVGITTSALGGLSTLVASFLARMRGSGEPELSQLRTKDLEQFLRECDAFQMDRGYVLGNEEDQTLDEFRKRLEDILGNTGNPTTQAKASPA